MVAQIRLEDHDKCPLCASRTLHDIGICFPFQTTSVRVHECANCRIAFSNPSPVEQDIPKLYEDRNAGGMGMGVTSGLVYQLRKARQRRYTNLVLANEVGPYSALDFGCGDGVFARHLALDDRFSRVVACDFASDPPPALAQLDLYKSNDELFTQFDERFDFIFLRHVIEHTKNPVEFVKSFGRLLGPSGKIVVEVPNFGSIWRKVFQGHYSQLGIPFHLFHFTKSSLQQAFDSDFNVRFERVSIPILGPSLASLLFSGTDNFSPLATAFLPIQIIIEATLRDNGALLAVLTPRIK